ncbi:MAG: polyphenol oxidase family protein [Spirochaetaceae bacterium]|jgi:YfiH family protein|nr:polyphenol oxidase family protein [Spirochaetaceae bacterium]
MAYPFRLSFSASGAAERAEFSFIIDGAPVRGPRCVLSSRKTGDMRYVSVPPNPCRTAFFASLGLDPDRVRSCVQVHSRKVVLAGGHDGAGYRRDIQADGLVSAGPANRITGGAVNGTANGADGGITGGLSGGGLRGTAAGESSSTGFPVLAVTVADCLPVFLWDTKSGALGLVHSGWKGTGIALEALNLMEKHWNSRPENVAVILGPCIQRRSYQVDAERMRQFEQLVASELGPLPEHGTLAQQAPDPFPGPLVLDDADGVHFYLGLQSANARLLESRGVRHIAYCEDCTLTDARLGSYRREGKSYTRMAALLGWF